jgi:hypothetical protein
MMTIMRMRCAILTIAYYIYQLNHAFVALDVAESKGCFIFNVEHQGTADLSLGDPRPPC